MKRLGDSSAIINAAVSVGAWRHLDTGQHFPRLHALAEVFATLTGRGVQGADAAGYSGLEFGLDRAGLRE